MNTPHFSRLLLPALFCCASAGASIAQDISSFCYGTATACPCGNAGTQGAGCMNSFGTAGKLIGSGNAQLSNDTVTLTAGGLPPGTTIIFLQGTSPANHGVGTVFGDGLMCAGGTVQRIAVRIASDQGLCSLGSGVAGDPSISSLSGLQTDEARFYAGWYRNAMPFCTADVFNLTNGVAVSWQL